MIFFRSIAGWNDQFIGSLHLSKRVSRITMDKLYVFSLALFLSFAL